MKNIIIFFYYFAYLTHKCLSVASRSDQMCGRLLYTISLKSCLNVYEMLKVNKYLFKARGTVNKVGFSNSWYRLKTALIVYLVLLKTHHTHLEQIHKVYVFCTKQICLEKFWALNVKKKTFL